VRRQDAHHIALIQRKVWRIRSLQLGAGGPSMDQGPHQLRFPPGQHHHPAFSCWTQQLAGAAREIVQGSSPGAGEEGRLQETGRFTSGADRLGEHLRPARPG